MRDTHFDHGNWKTIFFRAQEEDMATKVVVPTPGEALEVLVSQLTVLPSIGSSTSSISSSTNSGRCSSLKNYKYSK